VAAPTPAQARHQLRREGGEVLAHVGPLGEAGRERDADDEGQIDEVRPVAQHRELGCQTQIADTERVDAGRESGAELGRSRSAGNSPSSAITLVASNRLISAVGEPRRVTRRCE